MKTCSNAIKELYRTEKQISSHGKIGNAMCKAININFIGHYGNVPQVEMVIENQCVVFNAKGEGQLTIGYILQGILELLNLSEEDGIRLSDIRNVPLRVLRNDRTIVIAIGHFLEDKWLNVDELNDFGFPRVREALGIQPVVATAH